MTPSDNRRINISPDHQRSESGRGRDAITPWKIPWRGWHDVLWRTYNETMNDRLFYVAAGVAFFVLMSIFPAISALVSCYALIADPSTITQQISILKGIVPEGTYVILTGQVDRIIQSGSGSLSFAFVISLGFALWSANAGVKAIIDSLNVVYEQTDQRSFIRLTAISLAMTVGGIAVLIVSAAAFVVLPIVMSFVGFGGITGTITSVLRWPVLFFLILGTLIFLYRHGPYRTRARMPWVVVGGIAATVAWLATSALLSWYLSNFSDYSATYGSLGAVIGMMMWLWISFVVVLVGAELNAELEHQTARDSTSGPEKPPGERGATMADTIGSAQT
jgi:membrane protein